MRESGLAKWESLCDPKNGCRTACCYFKGSPCVHLDIFNTTLNAGRCRIYEKRFEVCGCTQDQPAIHQTIEGTRFKCANMADALMHQPAPAHCGYQVIRSIEGRPVVTE